MNKARSTGKGVKLDFTATAVRDMVKSGGIFPLLAAIASLIAAAALGEVGTAAGIALKKVTGKGYNKRGGNISQIAALLAGPLMMASSRVNSRKLANTALNLVQKSFGINPVEMMVKRIISKSGSGYKKREEV